MIWNHTSNPPNQSNYTAYEDSSAQRETMENHQHPSHCSFNPVLHMWRMTPQEHQLFSGLLTPLCHESDHGYHHQNVKEQDEIFTTREQLRVKEVDLAQSSQSCSSNEAQLKPPLLPLEDIVDLESAWSHWNWISSQKCNGIKGKQKAKKKARGKRGRKANSKVI
jgi:hypothetical protein